MKKERKGFDWSCLNKSFWTGVFVGIFAVLVSMLIGNVAYYSTHKEGGTAVDAEKNIFKKIMDEQLKRTENAIQNFGENIDDGRDEYDESIRRYWAKSGQPMPK